jgi:predicted TIM-barrel fold metal-dependent hydrolase
MGKKIDVHVHIGEDHERTYTAEDALRLMDKNGIDYAVISPVPTYPLPYGVESSRRQNNNIAAALQQYPDRFVRGLGVVDPRHGQAAVPEVDRIFSELGLHGLLFSNDKTGLTFDNPTMIEFIKTASKYDNPIIMAYTSQYSVLQAPFMLRKVAEMFPELTFINASAMKDTTHSNNSRYISASLPNVYIDMANMHQLMTPVEWALRDVGADKLLFGSNIPYCDHVYETDIIEAAAISEDEKRKIYYENASRVFGL